MEALKKCPICESDSLDYFLSCKDYTVSHESFTIVKCRNCEFVFTNPRPDPVTIGKYYKSEDYISHSDVRKGLISKLYHFFRNYTLLKKLQLVINLTGKPSEKISRNLLDIGCGTGSFLNICSKAGFTCFGIEPEKDARVLAQKKYNLEIGDESNLDSLASGIMDVITMWHVLEHVSSLNDTIQKIKRLLKPNGFLIVAVPNRNSFDAKYYKEFWAAFDTPRHFYHFTPSNVSKLFSKNNMKVLRTLPMKLDSFYISMLSEKYKYGRVNYWKAIFIGIKSNLLAVKTGIEFSSQIYVIRNE